MQSVSTHTRVVSFLDNVEIRTENESAKSKGPVRAAGDFSPTVNKRPLTVAKPAQPRRWNDGVLHWGLND